MNLFSPAANAWLRLALGGGALTILGAPLVMIGWARTPYATGTQEPLPQPVKFDHRHHVNDAAIECLYCHGDAMRSKNAGVPAISVCMGCHSQVWTTSPELAPVRNAMATGEPLHWRRVNRVPDFVYFDHSIHLAKGVACARCHGNVAAMGQVYATEPLTMRFCIDCHRSEEGPTHCTACHR